MLSDQLREAIESCGLTVYAVAKGSGVKQSVLSRFMKRERGITLDTADKLTEFFDMHLTRPKRPKVES